MCGIAGIAFKNFPSDMGIEQKQIEDLVDCLLIGIEHRGTHATGIVSARGRKTRMDKAPKRATEFIKNRRELMADPTFVLLHTRFATQGDPKYNVNNHPVKFNATYAVHNGHISNDADLFKEHKLKRNGEVDSEAIAAMFDKYGLDKAHLAMQKLQGGVATAVINPRFFPNTIVLAKGENSPCIVFENELMIAWASEYRTLDEAFDYVYGAKPKYDSTTSLKSGDILMMQDGTTEMLKYKVNYRTYMRSSYSDHWNDRQKTTSTGDRGHSAWRSTSMGSTEYGAWRKHKCLTCGCERYWHGEADLGGSCFNDHRKSLVQKNKPCTCKKFVIRKEDMVSETKRLTTGSGPAFDSTKPQQAGSFQIVHTADGVKTVKQYLLNGGTITYGACCVCKKAFEKDNMIYVYEHGFCGNCYKPAEGEVPLPNPMEGPETVQYMIGDLSVAESLDDLDDDPTIEDGIYESVTTFGPPNTLTRQIEEEVFADVGDLAMLDELREIALRETSATMNYDIQGLEWLIYETEDEDFDLSEETSLLFDSVIEYYTLELKKAVDEYLNILEFSSATIPSEDMSVCGVKAFDA